MVGSTAHDSNSLKEDVYIYNIYSVCAGVLYIWEGDPVISEQRSEIVTLKAQST